VVPHQRSQPGPGELSSSLRRNIEALRQRREQERLAEGWEERVADAITRFTGSMRFVYLHLVIYGLWIAANSIPCLPHFDPTFVILAMEASVEAIFLSTFVLISQNRTMAATEKRDNLDLQVNLLAEHQLTRLVTMVAAIAEKLEVRTDADSELGDIKKDIAPETVLSEIGAPILRRRWSIHSTFIPQPRCFADFPQSIASDARSLLPWKQDGPSCESFQGLRPSRATRFESQFRNMRSPDQ
jgi:uncharacterized membrane protein